jgi:hypothetical protein
MEKFVIMKIMQKFRNSVTCLSNINCIAWTNFALQNHFFRVVRTDMDGLNRAKIHTDFFK